MLQFRASPGSLSEGGQANSSPSFELERLSDWPLFLPPEDPRIQWRSRFRLDLADRLTTLRYWWPALC